MLGGLILKVKEVAETYLRDTHQFRSHDRIGMIRCKINVQEHLWLDCSFAYT